MALVQLGRKGRPETIVGIDLGTTNSLVAYVENGQPIVITTTEGQRLLPSVVSFEDDSVKVGFAARSRKIKDATKTIFSVKRLLGRSYNDLKEVCQELPYQLVKDENSADGLVRIKVGERQFTAVEISAMILKELKNAAEIALGKTVSKAVITVPAYFNDSQRQATRLAGRFAGLDVMRIVNEPTAAALAYGLAKKRNGLIAVYDLGGGTFDISILKLKDGIFEVLATNGDTRLGGDDFDQAIADVAIKEMESSRFGKVDDPESLAAVLAAAENLKIRFGTEQAAEFSVSIKGKNYRRIWSKEEFEKTVLPVIERTVEPCLNALCDADLDQNELSDVILVGGPTRLSVVQNKVEEIFGRRPNTSMHPDEVVAHGAAIQADILAGNNREFQLLDVVPLSLGIETYGGLMSTLIPRNTRIPTAAREVFTTFADNQTGVDLHVLQGEREKVDDNRSLAFFKLKGIPPMPARLPKIEVTFLVDADGILQVSAEELRTGKQNAIEVKPSHGLSDEEIDRILLESAENAEQDIHFRQLVEARNHAEPILITTQKKLKDAYRLLSEQEAKLVELQFKELETALKQTDIIKIQRAALSLDKATEKLAELLVKEAIQKAGEKNA